ncbi:MAG: DNA helicase PcrA [Lachnospiraceae bacterium]|nr:DNA helicase PcrA [Lachnospiraceae bacterium]
MGKYDALNPQQYQAVCHYEGPLLILAGAGSGKTRVLTHRVAWLIEEKNVNPWNIMAITFTNKAAGEMRDRVEAMLGGALGGVWVATFHSTCVRILRRYIDRIGFENNFTIYDSEDQKSVIKEICKRLQIDTKLYRERFFMAEISAAKDEMLSPVDYALKAQGDQRMQKVAEVYKEYQRQLFDNNALDFDDLICRTVELFQSCPEVLEQYQERFRFIMVDEYQDTNTAQFKLVSLLAAKYRNLCVVGDDDQSIYRFRGANIGNILNFEQFFPDAEVIRLEQNYRSTQNILNAANAVISHNKGRKEKTLWTDNGEGEKIRFRQFMNSFEEAEYVAGIISQKVGAGKWKYGDCAILYRTNAQSRMFEEKFLYANVPYKIVGGVNFYSRKEIKDVIAYLKTIANGKDDLAVRRIINVPKRGIGATTISRVQDYATEHGASFYDALRVAETIPGIGKSVAKLQAFVQMIQVLRTKQEFYKVKSLIEDILEQTGYMKELQAEGTDEALDRMANVDELLNKAALYDEKTENPTLDGFLEEVALVADIDNLEEDADHVVMMTLHSAKGLEFPVVFMVGMEDGVFPSYISISSEDESELEEERRLCYVGITRARTNLFLTSAKQRMVRGEIHYNRVSRFVDDIPEEFMAENERAKIPQKEKKDLPETKAHAAYRQMRENFKTKIMAQQQFEVKKADGLSYNVGDRVRHIKFGNGTVTNIAEGGRDYEVTVNFDRVGVKKMFASFAKLVKTEN